MAILRFTVDESIVPKYLYQAIESIFNQNLYLKFSWKRDSYYNRRFVERLFDDMENAENSQFLGILEWAVIESITEQGKNLTLESVMPIAFDRFCRYPNINLVRNDKSNKYT